MVFIAKKNINKGKENLVTQDKGAPSYLGQSGKIVELSLRVAHWQETYCKLTLAARCSR
jgi:hypothetical protein